MESQIDKGFKKVYKVLSLFFWDSVLPWMGNEALYHLLRTFCVSYWFTTTLIDRQFLEYHGCCISNRLIGVFKNLIKVFESVFDEMWAGSIHRCKLTNQKSSLLSNFRISVLQERRCNCNKILVNHLVGGFLMMN